MTRGAVSGIRGVICSGRHDEAFSGLIMRRGVNAYPLPRQGGAGKGGNGRVGWLSVLILVFVGPRGIVGRGPTKAYTSPQCWKPRRWIHRWRPEDAGHTAETAESRPRRREEPKHHLRRLMTGRGLPAGHMPNSPSARTQIWIRKSIEGRLTGRWPMNTLRRGARLRCNHRALRGHGAAAI